MRTLGHRDAPYDAQKGLRLALEAVRRHAGARPRGAARGAVERALPHADDLRRRLALRGAAGRPGPQVSGHARREDLGDATFGVELLGTAAMTTRTRVLHTVA